jgi:hypothetical protein
MRHATMLVPLVAACGSHREATPPSGTGASDEALACVIDTAVAVANKSPDRFRTIVCGSM